ncbi:HK97 family phage prohead protease [Bradyrhizobium sp. WSM 1704]|uniref:HK97 family phage prohead protease n=1 Tax=Bradyrhizobium semiaridum TaxID=2821404 RepID=UPI001CE39E18|nr:HK97 family phage prohead protease [Bradyrhizobium semiaridum]MCA6124558.1 HK97 family phage prohead protease [Bradyrhizobium semiaridum]
MDKLEVKATLSVTDEGEIVGTAWPFNAGPDTTGDIITKGAFNFVSNELPMLFGHDVGDLIGTWTDAVETADGLTVKGKLHLDQPRARTILGMIKSGLVSGLSIGFKTKSWTQRGRNRVIAALDLYEVSVVRNPAHPRARISSAKEYDRASAVASVIRDFTASI